jgi:TPR repeat protein
MIRRVGPLYIALALALAVCTGCGVVSRSRVQVPKPNRAISGVYFDEPFKLLEPFDQAFRRSCSCVEKAFALIPRIVDSPHPTSGGRLVPLRPSAEVFRVMRDFADARWKDQADSAFPNPRMLITGRGIPPLDGDVAIAAGVGGYLQLAQRGEPDAQAELGYLYALGFGVPQDDRWAAYWYGQAALKGWSDASLAIAAMSALGRGVPQDERTAVAWLFRTQHFHLMGDAYACGFGVEQDFEQARRFYEMMAEGRGPMFDRRSSDAQYQLGTMYLNGCGAPVDHKAASKWFQQAAEVGHPEAQVALSEMILRGSTDATFAAWDAYMWAEYALVRVPNDAPIRSRALAARDRAFAMLSLEQQVEILRVFRLLLKTVAESEAESLKALQSELEAFQTGGFDPWR